MWTSAVFLFASTMNVSRQIYFNSLDLRPFQIDSEHLDLSLLKNNSQLTWNTSSRKAFSVSFTSSTIQFSPPNQNEIEIKIAGQSKRLCRRTGGIIFTSLGPFYLHLESDRSNCLSSLHLLLEIYRSIFSRSTDKDISLLERSRSSLFPRLSLWVPKVGPHCHINPHDHCIPLSLQFIIRWIIQHNARSY